MKGIVYIVDDDAGVRDSVSYLMESVGLKTRLYASAPEFLDGYDHTGPACLLLDLRMPGYSGLETQELIRARGIDIPVIIMTGHGDVPAAVRAMKLGALDFLEKPCSDQALIDKVQGAIESDAYNRSELEEAKMLRTSLSRLSDREREVMALVASGKSNRETAQLLSVSPKTIETHRANLMRKLDAESLADLVRIAILAGVVEGRKPNSGMQL